MGHEIAQRQTDILFSEMLNKELNSGAEHRFLDTLFEDMRHSQFKTKQEIENPNGRPTIEFVLTDKTERYYGVTVSRKRSGIIIGETGDGKVAFSHYFERENCKGYHERKSRETWTTVELYQTRRRNVNITSNLPSGAETHSQRGEDLLTASMAEHTRKHDRGLFMLAEVRKETSDRKTIASAVYRLGGHGPLSEFMHDDFFLERVALQQGRLRGEFLFQRNMLPEFHDDRPIRPLSATQFDFLESELDQYRFTVPVIGTKRVAFATTVKAAEVTKSLFHNGHYEIVQLS